MTSEVSNVNNEEDIQMPMTFRQTPLKEDRKSINNMILADTETTEYKRKTPRSKIQQEKQHFTFDATYRLELKQCEEKLP